MHLGALLIFATAAIAQNYTGLCNSSISDANASGIFPLPEAYKRGTISENLPSWAVTIHKGKGSFGEDDDPDWIHKNLWYDTSGENYADDLAINYDVCAFVMYNLPTNAYRLGQSDPGNCSSMITDRCSESIKHMAMISAEKWTTYSSPPPYENLTAGVLPSICQYIRDDLEDTLTSNNCSGQLSPNHVMPQGK